MIIPYKHFAHSVQPINNLRFGFICLLSKRKKIHHERTHLPVEARVAVSQVCEALD